MALSRPKKRQRVTPAASDADTRESVDARTLAEATARVSDPSGRLAGEDAVGATAEDAAHWIAVYSELLAFKAELLEITARRRGSMSRDARGEAEADDVVIGAQADKYSRRLREWRAQVATMAPAGPGAPAVALFVEGRARTFGHLRIDPWKRTVANGGRPPGSAWRFRSRASSTR